MEKRVLILANNIQGIYNFRKELVERLRKEEYDIYISAPNHQLFDYFMSLGCTCIDTKIDRHSINPFTDIKLFFHYIQLIRRIRPTHVLTYTIKPNLYGGLACRCCKKAQLANITGLGSAFETHSLLQALIILMYKIGLKRAACVFLQNQENLEFCNAHKMIPPRQELLPGSGVNLQRFQLLHYPPAETTEFIFIGRIMKQKGIELYLTAAEQIHRKYPNTRFHILGAYEEDYAELITFMEKQGIVQYHKPTTNVVPYLAKVHCTIHPSYYPEGMSNVLLESCASGRAIITTNRSGCREIVDAGINGYLVQPCSLDDLIEKIEYFHLLPYEQKRAMGLAGRKKVEQQFNREYVINAYMVQIYSIQ